MCQKAIQDLKWLSLRLAPLWHLGNPRHPYDLEELGLILNSLIKLEHLELTLPDVGPCYAYD